jgi:hypothetical protein
MPDQLKSLLAGESMFHVECADCREFMPLLPDGSVDLVLTSPPYEDCRTYGIDFNLRGQAWVDWMVEVVRALSRICRGLIAIVCAGKTRKYRWSAVPSLLEADLHRSGFNLRNPAIYGRIGIPGSGGPDWLRGDCERIICVTRPGRLPWSDNTACGHAPLWGPGGAMSYRLSNGSRRTQWGGSVKGVGVRRKHGNREIALRPSHVIGTPRRANGEREEQQYKPPAISNPGNLVWCGAVGGGRMGDKLCHENEAPLAEQLAEFIIRTFCPPGGLVYDPFCGSGTTCAVARTLGRRSLGTDIRASQVELTERRLRKVVPLLSCFQGKKCVSE